MLSDALWPRGVPTSPQHLACPGISGSSGVQAKWNKFQGAGSAQSTQSSAHRMKISAIRNPIPEPPPVMKATLSLRKQEALYLLIFFNRKNFKEIDACWLSGWEEAGGSGKILAPCTGHFYQIWIVSNRDDFCKKMKRYFLKAAFLCFLGFRGKNYFNLKTSIQKVIS